MRSLAPLNGRKPCHELCGAEGFGNVIVRSSIEGGEFHGFLITHTQDEHRDAAPFAQSLQHLNPVHVRQTEIEQNDIGLVEDGVLQPELARFSIPHRVAL